MTNRPPYDRQLAAGVPFDLGAELEPIGAKTIAALRDAPVPHGLLEAAGLRRRDMTVVGHGGHEIEVSVIDRLGSPADLPGVLFLHPGGMVAGNRWSGIEEPLRWLERHPSVIVTVEYRLAPEHPDPVPLEDCFRALEWMTEDASRLGIDPARVLLAGASAGGGLAAGVALLARDRGGPRPIGVVLMCPMLDDRGVTRSASQFAQTGVWNSRDNHVGWSSLLGARVGTDAVSIHAAPARAQDLGGLPPVFIDCGSAEVFRDEDVAFASGIWAAGGEAELHVWPGGFHGFDAVVPGADLSQAARAARSAWVDRILVANQTGETTT